MSTTSSSDCDCEEYCHYARSLYENYGGNIYRTEMFPTLGHPLIYYSQINPCFQPQLRRQRSRKGNPNCFVKAFRWYTQEHVPFIDGGQSTKPNMNEFASWLDTKYEEFIQGKPNDQNSYRLTLKQTSIITAEKNPPNSCCGVCSSEKKKFKRIKSPWRKRQRRPCSREGAPCENNTQSFQYILQPKDLSRANSCCQSSIHTPSVETQKTQKIVIKSQSCTSFSREQSGADTIDIMTTQEGINKNLHGKKADPPRISSLNDMSCQCTIANIEKIDVGTQYDESSVNTKNTSILKSYQSTSFKSFNSSDESKCEKELRVSYSTNNAICQCPNDGKVTPSRSTSNSKTNLKSNSKTNLKTNSKNSPKSTPTVVVCEGSVCERVHEPVTHECPRTVSLEPKTYKCCPPVPMSNEIKLEKELKVSCSTENVISQSLPNSKEPPSNSGSNSKAHLKSTSNTHLKSTSKTNLKLNSKSTPPASTCCRKTTCERALEPVTHECTPEDQVIIETKTICECASPVEPKTICQCPQAAPIITKTGQACTQYERQQSCYDVGKRCSSHVSQTTNITQRKCPCEQPIRFDPTVENGVQTSDHCIIFDVNAPYTYPLFMKIVCADKLN